MKEKQDLKELKVFTAKQDIFSECYKQLGDTPLTIRLDDIHFCMILSEDYIRSTYLVNKSEFYYFDEDDTDFETDYTGIEIDTDTYFCVLYKADSLRYVAEMHRYNTYIKTRIYWLSMTVAYNSNLPSKLVNLLELSDEDITAHSYKEVLDVVNCAGLFGDSIEAFTNRIVTQENMLFLQESEVVNLTGLTGMSIGKLELAKEQSNTGAIIVDSNYRQTSMIVTIPNFDRRVHMKLLVHNATVEDINRYYNMRLLGLVNTKGSVLDTDTFSYSVGTKNLSLYVGLSHLPEALYFISESNRNITLNVIDDLATRGTTRQQSLTDWVQHSKDLALKLLNREPPYDSDISILDQFKDLAEIRERLTLTLQTADYDKAVDCSLFRISLSEKERISYILGKAPEILSTAYKGYEGLTVGELIKKAIKGEADRRLVIVLYLFYYDYLIN